MKKIILIALFALAAVNIHCGGGSTGSSKNTSLVTITVGSSGQTAVLHSEPETLLVKLKSFFRNREQTPAYASTPSGVHKIVFMIAGPDMSTMTKEVYVVGQTQIRESFSVPNGKNRYFLVEAKDISGKILFRGDTATDLEGKPVFLVINMKAIDSTPPSVVSTDPAGNKTGVPITSAIIVTFSETIDPATLNAATFSCSVNGVPVGGAIAVNGAVATFTPLSNLAYSTVYTATITTGVSDMAGNHMASAYSWSFTTAAAPDTTPPEVTGVSPGIGATSVPVTSTVTATFSEAIDSSTVNASTFVLTGPDEIAVPGAVTYSGLTATLAPTANLAQNTTYSALVTTGVRDLAGNALSADYSWSFTTAVSDSTPPSFDGLVSAAGASATTADLTWNAASDNVSPASSIAYEIYMATTSGGQNFASPVATVTGDTSATISGLTPNTTYYFIVRAKDEAGNSDSNTVEKHAKTFSSPSPADTTPPVFGGLVSAAAASSSSIELTWNEATDNVSPSYAITYVIYMGTTLGGQDFAAPVAAATGTTSIVVSGGLTPGTPYYFVARARDLAGNMETNTVERSATIPSLDLIPINPFAGPSDVSCEVTNTGTVSAASVTVFVEYTDGSGLFACAPFTITVDPVPPASPVPVLVSPTSFPPYQYRIIVDPTSSFPETNEGNNCVDNTGGTWCDDGPPTSCP